MSLNRLALVEHLGLSDEEIAFFKDADTPNTAEINQTRVLTTFVLAKRAEALADALDRADGNVTVALQISAKKIIASNEALSAATQRQTKALLWLTGVLAFATLLQAAAAAALIFSR